MYGIVDIIAQNKNIEISIYNPGRWSISNHSGTLEAALLWDDGVGEANGAGYIKDIPRME